jgi:hypothetical protein
VFTHRIITAVPEIGQGKRAAGKFQEYFLGLTLAARFVSVGRSVES